MKITDEIYSNLDDGEVQNRISTLGKGHSEKNSNQEVIRALKDLLARLEKQGY